MEGLLNINTAKHTKFRSSQASPSAPNSTATQRGCRNHPQFHPAYEHNQVSKRRSKVHPSHVAVGVHTYAGSRLIRPKKGWALAIGVGQGWAIWSRLRGQKNTKKGEKNVAAMKISHQAAPQSSCFSKAQFQVFISAHANPGGATISQRSFALFLFEYRPAR